MTAAMQMNLHDGRGGTAPPPELHSEQDMLAWKREYNIRQREADWKRRQDELLTQKRVAWEIERCERENRLAAARETRRREELEKRVQDQHLELDRRYKDRRREVEIDKRCVTWEKNENGRLMEMQKDAKENEVVGSTKRADEKLQRCEDMRNAASERAAKAKFNAELNAKREAKIREKEAQRQMRAAEEATQLKSASAAKSKAVVTAFTERTIPADGPLTSVLVQHPVTGPRGQLGPTPGSIL